MSTDTALAKRVVRRELHSSRSGAAVLVALLALIATAWIGTEAVLAALGQPALLLTPAAMAAGVRGLATVPAGGLIAAGVVLVLLGLVLLVLAFGPGRRGKHVVTGPTPTVADDAVLASSLSRAAADAARLDPDRVVASVGRRTATVRLTPTTGVAVDRGAVQRAVTEQAAALNVQPAVRAKVVVDRKGKVS